MRASKIKLVNKLAVSAVVAIMMVAGPAIAPGGVALAGGGGGPTYDWCPLPYGHGDSNCTLGSSIQDTVNKAKAANVPGTIFVNSGDYTENPVATGLKDVAFSGNADGGLGTRIFGSLTINKSKNISISAFNVTGGLNINQGSGVYSLGGNIGPLTISKSAFSNNPSGDGLFITHTGSVSLSGVTASKNNGNGLYISVDGAITLTDITALSNSVVGASLSSTSTVLVNASKSKPNHFDKNGQDGLDIVAPGNVNVLDLTASRNAKLGLSVSSGSAIVVDTNKTKMNRFDRNGMQGVYVTAPAGVTLLDVSAGGNGQDGVYAASGAGLVVATHRAKLLQFSKNLGNGLSASASGLVVVSDANARQNGLSGVSLTSGGGVAIVTFKSKLQRFDRNTNYGILISTAGAAQLIDVSTTRNGFDGAFVGSGGNVSVLTNKSKLNVFDSNAGNGLSISSNSTVDIHKIRASKNHVDGLNVQTNNANTTLTCGSLTKNLTKDIVAALGTANLILNSVKLTHPGLGDVNMIGSGTISVGTANCH